MDVLNSLYLNDILHTIGSVLLVPVVVLLLALIVCSLCAIGSLIVEAVCERRRYRAAIPQLVAQLEAADPDDLSRVIDESGLLRQHKDDLDELVNYLYLPEDARTEVAKRLLANESFAYKKTTGRLDLASKVAPMLGLMATLIPLGPGVVAMGQGDTQTLSSSLLVAFDGTVAGLLTAVVCMTASRLRKRWYADYLVSLEAAMNTLLEKASLMHAQGYEFSPATFDYDKAGRTAKKRLLTVANVSAAGQSGGGRGATGQRAAEQKAGQEPKQGAERKAGQEPKQGAERKAGE